MESSLLRLNSTNPAADFSILQKGSKDVNEALRKYVELLRRDAECLEKLLFMIEMMKPEEIPQLNVVGLKEGIAVSASPAVMKLMSKMNLLKA